MVLHAVSPSRFVDFQPSDRLVRYRRVPLTQVEEMISDLHHFNHFEFRTLEVTISIFVVIRSSNAFVSLHASREVAAEVQRSARLTL